ncbi:hypothetical protein NLJ89_g8940 [Agrocybe chaxingu]|uniref:t-SNARE coiled-coil homology domain-containing protein n=1 Tax=Agrocybe chaxingu TaxID=84603 RepID=A0A9W8JTZ3_9AGAR|nr:hypothetical protein NLJ89_g8940 [Agrocybe chaxingu]
MARDRLAAMRAQQGNVSSNSYPTQASGNGGYQGRRTNPYAQQDDRAYEMSDEGEGGGDMSAFYSEVRAATPGTNAGYLIRFFQISSIQDTIRTLNDNVARIGDLHSRSLNNMDDVAAQRNAAQLDELVEDTSALGASLKRRVKALEAQGGSGRDGQIRKQQTAFVKSKFVEAIQNYQTVEQQYRTKYKQRMERQYKIVKPDATPEEIRAVVNDEQGGQIFSQALMNSRYTDSRAAYREVQERHEDIKRIEKTLAELAQLFNDMSVLVEQQDETINVIQTQAAGVEKDTEAGLQYTDKAVTSARAARKKRWICFFITLVLLIIIGIVVGVVVNNQPLAAPPPSLPPQPTSVSSLSLPFSPPTPHRTSAMPAKKRCQFQIGTESQCSSAALRIVGECPHCRAQFCGSHRLPEHHDCSNLEDCRQQAFERNKLKLESERTVASKMATA